MDNGQKTLRIKLDVYGRRVLVTRTGSSWKAFYLGAEGKMRPADEIVIPSSVTESGLLSWIADLCHEWADEEHPEVFELDPGAGSASIVWEE